MSVQQFVFPKQNKLTGKKNIETLLSKGEAFFVYPYRIIYLYKPIIVADDTNCKVVIAVPKRKCKLAVQRNRIKRITREAYRMQQHTITSKIADGFQLQMMLQYSIPETITQQEAMLAIKKILQKLSTNIEPTT
jgi:ribonuclease P protein component